jgi:hypothetical protein
MKLVIYGRLSGHFDPVVDAAMAGRLKRGFIIGTNNNIVSF